MVKLGEPAGSQPRWRLAAVLLALLASASCAREDPDTVTLRFWAMGREGEVVAELARDFERDNPDIRVRVQQMPWTAAHEKLLTAHVGEATPDISQLGNTWIAEFVALDALAPLDRWIGTSDVVRRDRYFTGIWDTNVIDSTVYGIPWYVDTRVIFYRTDLLERAGYPAPPTTWRDWRTALERIRAQGGEGRYGIFLPTNEWAPPIILGMQSGSSFLRDGDRYGAFSDSAFRRGFDFYVAMFEDSLAPVLGDQQMANLYDEFARGMFAMYITGPWNIGEFRRRLPDSLQNRWATAPLPGPDGIASGFSLAGGSSIVVFKGSRHQSEAWRFIEYLSHPEQQVRFHHLTGNLPAVTAAWQDTALVNNRYAAAFHDQLQRVKPMPKVPEWELIVTKVFDHAEQAIRGNVPNDVVLRRLDAEVDRILEKRRWMLDRVERERPAADTVADR